MTDNAFGKLTKAPDRNHIEVLWTKLKAQSKSLSPKTTVEQSLKLHKEYKVLYKQIGKRAPFNDETCIYCEKLMSEDGNIYDWISYQAEEVCWDCAYVMVKSESIVELNENTKRESGKAQTYLKNKLTDEVMAQNQKDSGGLSVPESTIQKLCSLFK